MIVEAHQNPMKKPSDRVPRVVTTRIKEIV